MSTNVHMCVDLKCGLLSSSFRRFANTKVESDYDMSTKRIVYKWKRVSALYTMRCVNPSEITCTHMYGWSMNESRHEEWKHLSFSIHQQRWMVQESTTYTNRMRHGLISIWLPAFGLTKWGPRNLPGNIRPIKVSASPPPLLAGMRRAGKQKSYAITISACIHVHVQTHEHKHTNVCGP